MNRLNENVNNPAPFHFEHLQSSDKLLYIDISIAGVWRLDGSEVEMHPTIARYSPRLACPVSSLEPWGKTSPSSKFEDQRGMVIVI